MDEVVAVKLTSTQRSAVEEWQRRTLPGKNYAISDVFPAGDNGHRRAMHRLRALGLLQSGIPGGSPLKEAT